MKGFKLLIATLVLFGLTACGQSVEKSQETQIADNTETNKPQDEVEQKPEEQTESDDVKTYIDTELDPLVKSVSANIDTNWQFYMIEPFDRLTEDNNLESFKSDVGLLIDLFGGIAKQVDSLDVPEYLSEEDKTNVSELKDGLKSAINKRIEAAESLIGMSDSESVLQSDVTAIVSESNESLMAAVKAYEQLISRN